jgi:hypothetical protein
MRPSADLKGHLTFLLKHEVLNLELLARLFKKIDPQDLIDWISSEPSGQYARRVGFLFEWLTGITLSVLSKITGNYVDLLDSKLMVTASKGFAVTNRRWRVRNNLAGTPAFCPMIRKSPELIGALSADIENDLHELELEFGQDVLMRSAVWMTLRESKASFAIEGEAHHHDRIQRFADVLARRAGYGAIPLDEDSLRQLQTEILGTHASLEKFGIRQSPVFVGEVVRYQELVHYVAPMAEDVEDMLKGLGVFLERTGGQSSVMRSAVAAFGFVYIHPLADGNGRVHRFLIQDILRRDGLVHSPMILPISSSISRDSARRHAYNQVLDVVSAPLMRALAGHYKFSAQHTVYPDGIRSNFEFNGQSLAKPVWQYPDLTAHVVYLSEVLQRTVREDMREESRLVRNHSLAKAAVKDILEMPDPQIDRVIRSVMNNEGKLSNALVAEIPALSDSKIWMAVKGAITKAFMDD